MLGFYIFVVIYSFNKFSIFLNALTIICYLFFFFSYTACLICDPGYPKNTLSKYSGKPRSEYAYCEWCHFYYKKSENVEHCSDCDICVEGYDHHCPWIGKCVGKNNSFYFKSFLAASIVAIGYLFFAVFMMLSKDNE